MVSPVPWLTPAKLTYKVICAQSTGLVLSGQRVQGMYQTDKCELCDKAKHKIPTVWWDVVP